MNASEIQQLLELIGRAVHLEGPWKGKRTAIFDQCSEEDITNLEEFCAWFDTDTGE
jgi:hypothetical protein